MCAGFAWVLQVYLNSKVVVDKAMATGMVTPEAV